jgi:hypothetical protein
MVVRPLMSISPRYPAFVAYTPEVFGEESFLDDCHDMAIVHSILSLG